MNLSQFPFLYDGQTRRDDYVHNGRWYNARAENIGWGDLSLEDLRKIRDSLIAGDVFYVVSEGDWYNARNENIDQMWLAANARFVINVNACLPD